jgi:chemotaxis protein CheX
MNVKYINPFLTSTVSAFETRLDCALTRGKPYVKDQTKPAHEVSGIIGLSGKAQGMVVVSLCREAALGVTEAMLQERPDRINADVTDAVGELANIVAGGAKGQLEHLEMQVSLPTVITGNAPIIGFPSRVTPICIPFHSKWGPITVEVGLVEEEAKEKQAAATAASAPA